MNDTLTSYIQEYFQIYLRTSRNLAPNTIDSYVNDMYSFVKFLKLKNIQIDSIKIEEISFELIIEYISWLRDDQKNNPKTINHKIINLKNFFTYIGKKEITTIDICEKINHLQTLKTKDKETRYLSVEELHLLMKELETNETHYTIVALMYDSGMRVSSICNLKIENITIYKNKVSITITDDKNNSRRVVEVGSDVKKLIEKYLKKEQRTSGYLFLNKYGNKFNRRGIGKIVRNAYSKAKEHCTDKNMFRYDKFSPQDLRHSKATNLLKNGIKLQIIRDVLGHKHISTTEHYARIVDEERNKILLEQSVKLQKVHKRTKKEKTQLEEFLENIKNL